MVAVEIEVCGFPPFALKTHKGWGTQILAKTRFESAPK
jgi:hypothetical protein